MSKPDVRFERRWDGYVHAYWTQHGIDYILCCETPEGGVRVAHMQKVGIWGEYLRRMRPEPRPEPGSFGAANDAPPENTPA